MTDPFSLAIDVLFSNAHLTTAVTYTPAGGPAVALNVVLSRPDREIDLGVAGLQVPSWRADVRASDLPSGAARGDTLSVGAETFTVRKIAFDAPRLIASLDLDPA
jgi:hypothetical protein